MNKDEFKEAFLMLRSSDPMTFENGYYWIQGDIDNYVDELIKIMLQENNPKMRGRFVELLGESSNTKVITFLSKELKHKDREVKAWAYGALKNFDDPESNKIISEFTKNNPNEDFI